jgi:alpha-D-ribose 1-methylphosphonate 5-triphosphate synthase subunit PhnG
VTEAIELRRRWMAALALAPRGELEAAWQHLGPHPPSYRRLRGPEVGLVMVRGRAGGTGMRFNVGETPVARCSVQLEGGAVGHAWVRGRDRRHAELAAVFDALLQDSARQEAVMAGVVEPLERACEARRAGARERAARTRVEFFTMVRGED